MYVVLTNILIDKVMTHVGGKNSFHRDSSHLDLILHTICIGNIDLEFDKNIQRVTRKIYEEIQIFALHPMGNNP